MLFDLNVDDMSRCELEEFVAKLMVEGLIEIPTDLPPLPDEPGRAPAEAIGYL